MIRPAVSVDVEIEVVRLVIVDVSVVAKAVTVLVTNGMRNPRESTCVDTTVVNA